MKGKKTKKKKSKKKSAKWLRALEAQSWQAELLVSGLVIAGLLQLPDVVIHWVEGYIMESSEMGYLFLMIASIFFLVGIDCLIFFFGCHLLFRGIWIALLGLNSVYPEGININSTTGAGPKYWKIAKEKYPNLSAYNQELDETCSLIFSVATVTVIMMTSFSVLLLFIYQLFRLLISFFPIISDYVLHIGGVLYLIFTIMTYGMQYLLKKYPDNKRVEKMAKPYGAITGSIFSLYIFEKPLNYIISILTSNTNVKYFSVVVGVLSGFLGFMGAYQTGNSPIYDNFDSPKYITFNNKPYHSFDFNYDNLRPEGVRIFTPMIPSDIISGSVLKLFIPTIDREKEQMNLKEYSFIEKLKTDRAIRDSTYEANLPAYADFNQIFINDQAYTNPDFQYYTHPNAGEQGVLTYLSTTQFEAGKNVLEIRKNYFSKDSVQKIVAIPFYFERGE